MNSPYYSHPSTWKYKGGPLAFLGLPFVFIIPIVCRLWWLTPPLMVCVLRKYNFSWSALIVPVVVASGLVRFVIVPSLMNIWAMIGLTVGELTWPEAARRDDRSAPFVRPGWKALLLSFPVPFFVAANLASILLVKPFFPPNGTTWQKLGFVAVMSVSNLVLRLIMLVIKGQVGKLRSIVYFWKFDSDRASVVKDHLTAVFTAYGNVSIIDDADQNTFLNARENVPEDAPVGYLDRISGEDGEWQTKVRDLILGADIAIVDVTDLSYWVAWEILQCLQSPKPPAIILVGHVAYFMENHEFVEKLQSEMRLHVGDPLAIASIQRLERPIPYSDDLANLIFKWRFYRRMQRASNSSHETSRS